MALLRCMPAPTPHHAVSATPWTSLVRGTIWKLCTAAQNGVDHVQTKGQPACIGDFSDFRVIGGSISAQEGTVSVMGRWEESAAQETQLLMDCYHSSFDHTRTSAWGPFG